MEKDADLEGDGVSDMRIGRLIPLPMRILLAGRMTKLCSDSDRVLVWFEMFYLESRFLLHQVLYLP